MHHSSSPINPNSPFDPEELNDLGLRESDIQFVEDMTFIAFQEAEKVLRSALPMRQFDWWDSDETRSRAEWELRKRSGSLDTPLCDKLIRELTFCRGAESPESVDLNWLLTTSQEDLEAWRAARTANETLLNNLSHWIDDDRYNIASGLVTPAVVRNVVHARLAELTPREREIITLRTGLKDGQALTLEEVGRMFVLTRARIGQIESRAWHRMEHPARRLHPVITRLFLSALLTSSKTRSVQSAPIEDAARLVERNLAPEGRLLFQTLSPDERDLLFAEVGLSYKKRFFLGCSSNPAVGALALRVDESQDEQGLPLPLPLKAFVQWTPVLKDEIPVESMYAIAVSENLDLVGEYVLPARKPRAMLDAIELHRRMLHFGGYVTNTFFGRRETAEPAPQKVPDFGRRDINAATDFPHLFMKLGDDAWIALNCDLDLASRRNPTRGNQTYLRAPRPESSIAKIAEVVAEQGVARLKTVRVRLPNIPEGTIHALTTSRTDQFERVAPGTYALTDSDLTPHEHVLLDRWQIEHYLLGRKCGEILGSYRAWTPSMELKWCGWARANAPKLYPRLLWYASINEWPVSKGDQAWWTNQKQRFARDPGAVQIHPSGPPEIPDPTELVEMICMIKLDGGINPLRVNRSLGARPRISTTWPYMAILIAAGWLEDQAEWYLWHPCGFGTDADPHDAILRDLIAERMARGANDPASDAFLSLLSYARDGLRNGDCQWLRPESQEALIHLLHDIGASTLLPPEEGDQDTTPTLEEMLRENAAQRALESLRQGTSSPEDQ